MVIYSFFVIANYVKFLLYVIISQFPFNIKLLIEFPLAATSLRTLQNFQNFQRFHNSFDISVN